MIKINLARPQKKTISSSDASQMSSVELDDLAALRKTAILRLVIILLGPIALFAYEGQTIPELQARLSMKRKQLTTLTEKNEKAREAVAQTKKFKKEQEMLQSQINQIESLKRDRLREVKILDFVQKDIPPKLWLMRMEMNDGKISIQGMSTTDAELTQFMDNLSRSAYLKEVSLVRSTDFLSQEYGALKRFEISCLLEKTQ